MSVSKYDEEQQQPQGPQPQEKVEYLPAWVRKMRQKIELSKIDHELLETRLGTLSLKTKELDGKIWTLNPKLEHIKSNNNNRYPLAIKLPSSLDQSLTPFVFKLFDFPVDIIGQFLQYLSVVDVCQLEAVCRYMKSIVLDSEMWSIYYKSYFHYHGKGYGISSSQFKIVTLSRNNHEELRGLVILHAQRCKDCLRFVRSMKDQRAIPKHRSIQPHRHAKSERQVTHPLPVFDPLYNTESALIMSRAETFNSDFRLYANQTLDLMHQLTSNEEDPLHEQLASEGAISVLVSLLSNEAGAFQSLSCGILANLLCWETRRQLVKDEYCMNGIKQDAEEYHEFFHERQSRFQIAFASVRKSIREQIEACNGSRLLVSLLTSPTASINLAGSQTQVTGGYKEGRMTASVQGVANKEASRALSNLFDPLLPLPATMTSAVHVQVHQPFMSSFILHEEFARPWRFSYYHKSGALKDRFNAYLKFSPDGYLRGRGVDAIGIFYLTGKVDVDITGYAWYFHKTYVSQIFVEEELGLDLQAWLHLAENEVDTSGQRTKSHVSHLGYWSAGRDLNINNNAYELNRTTISTAGRTDESGLTSEQEQMKLLNEIAIPGIWGLGMYGVWETASNNSHFDLQKGGIFRANPIMIL